MALEVPYDDLRRDFVKCLVMYKNKPVFINSVTQDGIVRFTELITNKDEKAPFTLKAFGAPIRRVGFVNCKGSVVYMSRIPVRKYHMGLCKENTVGKTLAGVEYPDGTGETRDRVSSMCCPELGLAILDEYPSLPTAITQAIADQGACAFDKQFCVTRSGKVFYKGAKCGFVKSTAQSVNDIVFDKGSQHLILLLEKNYEKTVRDFRPTAS